MARKTIYTIIGYTHDDYRNQWNTYGAFTTLKRAEEEIKLLADTVLAGYRDRAENDPEEYGDMSKCSWEFNRFFGVLNMYANGHKQKHCHLEIRGVTLRSGED